MEVPDEEISAAAAGGSALVQAPPLQNSKKGGDDPCRRKWMCLFCINAFSSDIAETCQWRMEKSVVCTDRGIIIASVSK